MIDGPSPEHELVLQGRTEGQAPDIDAVVYLTDCDPATYRPGDLIRAEDRRAPATTTWLRRRPVVPVPGESEDALPRSRPLDGQRRVPYLGPRVRRSELRRQDSI